MSKFSKEQLERLRDSMREMVSKRWAEHRDENLDQLSHAHMKARETLKKKWLDPDYRARMAKVKRRPGTGRPPVNPELRFMRFVKILDNGCWEWVGKINAWGYGQFSVPDGKKGKTVPAHKWIYERKHGPIPPDKESDHLCHKPENCQGGNECPHRRCVNPDHVTAATRLENLVRSHSFIATNVLKTHCKNGHPLSGDNLKMRGPHHRECKICAKARWVRAQAKKRI